MEIGSKLGIYKLNKVEPPNGGAWFYKATVFEKVYNSKNPVTHWENCFYNAYLFDQTLELEPAEFTLDKNKKDKFSFDNIGNPTKSIIRVINFKYEKHTKWYGRTQQKDDYGKPILEDIFYLTEIQPNIGVWKSEERRSRELEKKLEQEKQRTEIWKQRCADLRNELAQLRHENHKGEQIIAKHKTELKQVKSDLKNANYQTMVYKRKNTITNQKLEDTRNNLNKVKKMKKAEVIEEASRYLNEIDFGEI